MKVSSLQLEWNSVNADSLLLYHLIPPAILRSVYQAGKEYTGGGGEPSTLRCAHQVKHEELGCNFLGRHNGERIGEQCNRNFLSRERLGTSERAERDDSYKLTRSITKDKDSSKVTYQYHI